MSDERPTYGQAIFLFLVGECSSTNDRDGGATTLVAQDAIALKSFSGLGSFRSAWNSNKLTYLDVAGLDMPEVQQRRQFWKPYGRHRTRLPERHHKHPARRPTCTEIPCHTRWHRS